LALVLSIIQIHRIASALELLQHGPMVRDLAIEIGRGDLAEVVQLGRVVMIHFGERRVEYGLTAGYFRFVAA
jgi:hypothetical protein